MKDSCSLSRGAGRFRIHHNGTTDSLQTNKYALCFMVLLGLCMQPAQAAPDSVHHQIAIKLIPQQQSLQVTDRVELAGQTEYNFVLHAGLKPVLTSAGASLDRVGRSRGQVDLENYRVTLDEGHSSFTIRYRGRIAHPFSTLNESPGRSRQLLPGTISEQGVFLDSSVAWFPFNSKLMHRFDMTVDLPQDWLAVSQGDGPNTETLVNGKRVSWQMPYPQDDIYLVAGSYHLYRDQQGRVESQVFVRQPDSALAQRYLDATRHYIALYDELIGDYPYAKFALVENFWETGYGMPSFTLLGSRVIRLPFILHSSYPHEILHNWWGNGVYVDYAQGNWSEGLTAYLADHLIKEQRGQGATHRRESLQRFSNFVREQNDFTLSRFRSRHSGSSQAVGYDKAMMLFHMLRRRLGDRVFIDGLRRFYRDHRFARAGFADIQRAFEQVSGQELGEFFRQWLHRRSMPALQIDSIKVVKLVVGYRIELQLLQSQQGKPFTLEVPVVVYTESDAKPLLKTLTLSKRTQTYSIDVPGKPLRLDVDPGFDLARIPHDSEAPAVLSGLFGSSRALFVLPAKAPKHLLQGYRSLAEQWARDYDNAAIKLDSELSAFPQDSFVWLLGWRNALRNEVFARLGTERLGENEQQLQVAGHGIDRQAHSLVLTHRDEQGQTVGWVGTTQRLAIPGLSRKLPHYGKYSYLVFDGAQPSILHKGQWPVTGSVLKAQLAESSNEIVEYLAPSLVDSLQ